MTRAWRDIEGPIHRSVLAELRRLLPSAVIHHSPNELALRGKHVARQIAKAKHNGMVPGWPDIEVMHQGSALFFEVKAEGNKLSDAQQAVRDQLEAQGFRYAVARSVDDVREALTEWSIESDSERERAAE